MLVPDESGQETASADEVNPEVCCKDYTCKLTGNAGNYNTGGKCNALRMKQDADRKKVDGEKNASQATCTSFQVLAKAVTTCKDVCYRR